ncbi:hypothetical protein V496_01338 [Pseudogymnoascus sp. VKM F-4515 (FW-2607)]|nr:hypothetical protein V496_01338 [Pseudogymnoascus sp. VKM F-4515 (FW-2607)]KFY95080.1 hypothetical protein V498_03527 [Pseudogymnoascus sp. VKM F-4517 (FW-2822)]
MHTHSKTCTKYQKKFPRTRTSANPVPIVQSKGMATDANESSQRLDTLRQLPSQFCRFLFPRPLVLESMVTEEGYIRMERNHQFVNKYNPVIASAIGYNHNVNFTALSPKVNRGQLVLAAAVLKKAQEASKAAASKNGSLLAPEPLNMSKFALKAYNRFTRDIEVKTNVRKVLNSLLNETSDKDMAESANQKERSIEFDDYLKVVDHNVYTEDKEVNVDMDFAMLRLTESNLLQAALAFLEDDVATLNLRTIENRIANGEIPLERTIIRLNCIREEANLVRLRAFAKSRGQKIYLFPARHNTPTGTNLDPLTLLRMIYQVGKEGYLKGPGFFAFTKVNGMRGTAKEVILDSSIFVDRT